MPRVIHCPFCGKSLNLPEDALAQQVQCPGCARTFQPSPTQESGPVGIALEIDDEDSPPQIRGLPPVPQPFRPVLIGSVGESPKPMDEGMDRCPRCKARVTRNQVRCLSCGNRLAADDDKPWERENGPLRRDIEPHRGTLISSLGKVTLCLAVPGLMGIAFAPFMIASLLAAGLGFATIVMAKDDVDAMDRKVMDPQGMVGTRSGLTCATVGMWIGLGGLALAGVIRLPLLFSGLP